MRYNCKMLLRILHAQVGPIPLLRTKIQRKVKILTKFAFHFSLFVFFFFFFTHVSVTIIPRQPNVTINFGRNEGALTNWLKKAEPPRAYL